MANQQPAPPQNFVAPHPGSHAMPRWDVGQLPDAPKITMRSWALLLGPGLVAAGAAIGGGEWLAGPLTTAQYGGGILWLATVSIFSQLFYNLEICRYTLYCGEPIFSGKFRTLPGPWFWLLVYLFFDFSVIFSYHAASAAIPIEVILLGGQMPDHDHVTYHWWLNKGLSTAIFLFGLVPLIFGGKIFDSLKVVMSLKLVLLFGFLLILGCLFSKPATWGEIWSGFFQIGNELQKRFVLRQRSVFHGLRDAR